jgi:hypothetical protein
MKNPILLKSKTPQQQKKMNFDYVNSINYKNQIPSLSTKINSNTCTSGHDSPNKTQALSDREVFSNRPVGSIQTEALSEIKSSRDSVITENKKTNLPVENRAFRAKIRQLEIENQSIRKSYFEELSDLKVEY